MRHPRGRIGVLPGAYAASYPARSWRGAARLWC